MPVFTRFGVADGRDDQQSRAVTWIDIDISETEDREWLAAWDEVDEQLILGALPLKRFHPQLRQLGVTAMLNMCAEWEDPLEELAADSIVYHRVPTIDFSHQNSSKFLRGPDL